jgi:hypothetical protein
MPVRRAVRQALLVIALMVAPLAAIVPSAQAHYGPTRWDCLAHY